MFKFEDLITSIQEQRGKTPMFRCSKIDSIQNYIFMKILFKYL